MLTGSSNSDSFSVSLLTLTTGNLAYPGQSHLGWSGLTSLLTMGCVGSKSELITAEEKMKDEKSGSSEGAVLKTVETIDIMNSAGKLS